MTTNTVRYCVTALKPSDRKICVKVRSVYVHLVLRVLFSIYSVYSLHTDSTPVRN